MASEELKVDRRPSLKKRSFDCPHCSVYSTHSWADVMVRFGVSNFKTSLCEHCYGIAFWSDKGEMLFPKTKMRYPNKDLSEEIKKDFLEASSIVSGSPRGACALLRLCIQKLCLELGENRNLDTAIKNLVSKGLPVLLQQALDTVRVIGNEAVHPGELDLKDDKETAESLFGIVNFIADKMISEPKKIEQLFNKIPEKKRREIDVRDGISKHA